MDKATKALASKVAEIERIVHTLRDAPRKEGEQSYNQQYDAGEEHDATKIHPAVALKTAPADNNSAASKEHWYRSFPWWKILEGAGIFAAMVYAVVTYYMWHDAHGNFKVDERAWLKPIYEVPPDISVAAWNIHIANVGKSPATQAFVDLVFEIVDANRSPSFSFSKRHNGGHTAMIFPGDREDFVAVLDPDGTNKLSGPTLSGLLSGSSYVAVFGDIVYWDQFGKHWTEFCSWRSYGGAKFNADSCIFYNKVGDGNIPKD